MPTDQRVDEIVDLATILLSEYRQGTALHDLPQRDGDLEIRGDTTLVIEVNAGGNGLAGLVAALDAVQLAVDAAAVAVFYDREIPDRASQQLSYDFLRNLVREQNVSLEIVALAGGSFGVKFRAQFRNPVTRATAIAVAVVSTAALNIILPRNRCRLAGHFLSLMDTVRVAIAGNPCSSASTQTLCSTNTPFRNVAPARTSATSAAPLT